MMRVFLAMCVCGLLSVCAFSQDSVQERREAAVRKTAAQAVPAKVQPQAKAKAAVSSVPAQSAASQPAKSTAVKTPVPPAKQAAPAPASQPESDEDIRVTVISPSDGEGGQEQSYSPAGGASIMTGSAEGGVPYSFGSLKSAFPAGPGVTALVFEDSSRVVRVVHLRGAGRKAVWELVTEIARSSD